MRAASLAVVFQPSYPLRELRRGQRRRRCSRRCASQLAGLPLGSLSSTASPSVQPERAQECSAAARHELCALIAALHAVARRRPHRPRPPRLEPPPRPAATCTASDRSLDVLQGPPRGHDFARVAAHPLAHPHLRPHLRPLAPDPPRPPQADDAARARSRPRAHLCRRRQQERALHPLDRRARRRGPQRPPQDHGKGAGRRRVVVRRAPHRQRLARPDAVAHHEHAFSSPRRQPVRADGQLGRLPRGARRGGHARSARPGRPRAQRDGGAVGPERAHRRAPGQRGRHLDLLGPHARHQEGPRERRPQRVDPRGRRRRRVGPRAPVEPDRAAAAAGLGLELSRALLGQGDAQAAVPPSAPAPLDEPLVPPRLRPLVAGRTSRPLAPPQPLDGLPNRRRHGRPLVHLVRARQLVQRRPALDHPAQGRAERHPARHREQVEGPLDGLDGRAHPAGRGARGVGGRVRRGQPRSGDCLPVRHEQEVPRMNLVLFLSRSSSIHLFIPPLHCILRSSYPSCRTASLLVVVVGPRSPL